MTQIMDMFSHFFCFENFQSNLSKKQHNPYLPSYDRQSFGTKRQGKRELPRITTTASSNMICCWVHKPALWITTLFSVVSCITVHLRTVVCGCINRIIEESVSINFNQFLLHHLKLISSSV